MREGDFRIWCLYFVVIVVLYETVRKLWKGHRYIGEIEFDERTNRITKQSLSVSWCLTFATVGMLAFAGIFRLELLTAHLVIAAVSGVMIGSFPVAHCYYSRMGAVG